ncbi:hypothetical protein CKAH01_16656 [Colletotrichum kahawae]|uniref:Uncharacterized protein n=1 Tax=Colletotrichum kahawae TaxID=34407 RepID=A0AAE0D5W5_COLKA|nr:hypothetical protein CKAH01_16656 [Colletotrichum kahawae]
MVFYNSKVNRTISRWELYLLLLIMQNTIWALIWADGWMNTGKQISQETPSSEGVEESTFEGVQPANTEDSV